MPKELNDSLRRKIINLLASIPSLRERAGRDAWLKRNLPLSVQDQISPRDDNTPRDLTFIVDIVQTIQLEDGRWVILILLDNLRDELKDITLRDDIEAMYIEAEEELNSSEEQLIVPSKYSQAEAAASLGDPKRLAWLNLLAFNLDPFRNTNGGTDRYLQKYFYKDTNNFYGIYLDVSRTWAVFVFGSPGSGKSSMRNAISQLCRDDRIFPILYKDFGPLVQKRASLQFEDHVTEILKIALRTLADIANQSNKVDSPSLETKESSILRNQLWLYVSEYEDDPRRKQILKDLLNPDLETEETLALNARERLARFCRYLTALFEYQFVYILVDPDDDIAPNEDDAWQVLESLLSRQSMLELSDDKVTFKFFLSQKFRARAQSVDWLEAEWEKRCFELEWPDEELHKLLQVRLKECSNHRFVSLGALSPDVIDLDDRVVELSIGSPRKLIVICDRLFNEHCRGWSPDNEEDLFITAQEVSAVLKSFKEDHPMSPQEQRMEQWIEQWETDKIEFKSTMRYNRKAAKRDDEMDREIARTMCAFMNTEGGILIIGVDDDKTVLGLDDDISTLSGRNKEDVFERAFVNITEGFFDTPVLPNHYTAYFMKYQNRMLYVAEVKKSEKPVYCQFGGGTEFYVRKQNTTKKLDAKAINEYFLDHFKN